MEFRREMLFVFLAILLIWFIMRPNSNEAFDASGSEFLPVGRDRYGLRGDLLRRSDISRLYLNPNRQIRINPSSGWMYASNKTPCEEGINGCKKVNCPCNTNEYDGQDTCWNCGSAYPDPMVIPDIHPHVPN